MTWWTEVITIKIVKLTKCDIIELIWKIEKYDYFFIFNKGENDGDEEEVDDDGGSEEVWIMLFRKLWLKDRKYTFGQINIISQPSNAAQEREVQDLDAISIVGSRKELWP